VNEETLFWNTISSSIATLAGFAGAITVLVIVATVVRRQRPDAYRPLLWWSIGSLVFVAANFVGYPALAFFVRDSGTEGYLKALSIFRIVTSLAHLGLAVVLVRGLVAIAQPPKPIVVESDAPYR
jgi:hypothetical protein